MSVPVLAAAVLLALAVPIAALPLHGVCYPVPLSGGSVGCVWVAGVAERPAVYCDGEYELRVGDLAGFCEHND